MNDLDQCPCAGINLDKLLQPTILALLAESDLHGYGLIQKIVNSVVFRNGRPDPTGIYRFLKIMETRGLVISEWDLTAVGPPKKTYKITSDGVTCLARWIETLEEYRTSVNRLIRTAKAVLESSPLGRRPQ